MTNLRYTFTDDGASRTLTVFLDGDSYPFDHSHPNFDNLCRAARAGDAEALTEALDIPGTLSRALAESAPGFTVENGTVLYQGEAVSNDLSARILAVLRESGDLAPFVNFARKLEANPSKRSREQLFRWVSLHGLSIDPEGNLIAYKGVNANLTSISAGPGIVNGVETTGNLDNSIGNTLEVQRRYVDDDPSRGCSTGLHAGTWEYASAFGNGRTLTVQIDPADVVSVPLDCNFQKIRTAKYVVLSFAESKWVRSTVWSGAFTEDDYFDDLSDEDYDDEFWDGEDE